MKFCAVICEYNPFHNGHRYQLAEIRKASGCDKILCLMSGNFTQRGEPAVFNKYVRARHALTCGADAVIELPAAFAVSPAELFARGAGHILASQPAVEKLAYGCEHGTKEEFLATAKATLTEDKQFK
ncbi:MAG: nucleotidyltransferase family protein, partial [Clostridia bacterium]|nr:nucleotidyltransferase family protein [Clostridia bacterium]